MALPPLRSMNSALDEGATDGRYKKVVQNRENADYATYQNRESLADVWYGIHEDPYKVVPGRSGVHHTPNFVHTPEVR